MADTIETFVSKLKSDGIEAGRREAEGLREAAQKQAGKLVADAKAQADKIVADAKTEAAKLVARGKTELELATRDTILKLRDALTKILQTSLRGPVNEVLSDAEFMRSVIQDIAMKYVEADIHAKGVIKVNLAPEMHKKLVDWAIGFIHKARPGAQLDLKDTLRQSGFEYNRDGSTVEITTESVTALLMEMVGPSLKEILKAATVK